MNKIFLLLLVALLSSPIAYARDYWEDDKYSNPRARGSDSVYDAPRTSESYDYNRNRTNTESVPDSYSQPSRPSNGTTYNGNLIDSSGLIINRE